MAHIVLRLMEVPITEIQYLTGRGWGRLSAFGILPIMVARGKLVPIPPKNHCLAKQGLMAIP